jgi:lactoylglutathione lyase
VSSVAPRPFRVLGLQQVAIGAPTLAPLLNLWGTLLGVPLVGSYESARENVDERIARLGTGLFAVELDLMRPLDPDRRPRVHDPALNHLGLWVDHLHRAVGYLVSAGVRIAPGGIRRGAGGHEVCFIHPKPSELFPLSGQGVLIELVQAPPELVLAHASTSDG